MEPTNSTHADLIVVRSLGARGWPEFVLDATPLMPGMRRTIGIDWCDDDADGAERELRLDAFNLAERRIVPDLDDGRRGR